MLANECAGQAHYYFFFNTPPPTHTHPSLLSVRERDRCRFVVSSSKAWQKHLKATQSAPILRGTSLSHRARTAFLLGTQKLLPDHVDAWPQSPGQSGSFVLTLINSSCQPIKQAAIIASVFLLLPFRPSSLDIKKDVLGRFYTAVRPVLLLPGKIVL